MSMASNHLISFYHCDYPSGGGRALSDQMGVRFLGEVPIDPRIAQSMDSGLNLLQGDERSPLDTVLDNILSD